MPAVERPKAKRLRAGKAHRTALLESLPEEQRPIAEQVVLGGLPAVRQAIEKQNAERTAAGDKPIAAGPLLELAEQLVPKVRTAEWRDRAEAAQRDLEVIDLRDLRSVVSAADAAAKDDETRALAQALREGLVTRADAEHQAWLAELTATVDVGRIVRALRLSSRPPKAGAPLPPELATRLADGAGAALTEDAAAERWVAVLDALAFSPVRDKVIPASLPKELHDDVRSTIARLATRIPKIAHIFEIAPDRNAPRPKVERRKPKKSPAQARPKPEAKRGDKPKAKDEPKADEAAEDASPNADEPRPRAGDEPTPRPAGAAADADAELRRAAGDARRPAGGETGGRADPEPGDEPQGVRGSPPQIRRRAAPPTRSLCSASRRRAPTAEESPKASDEDSREAAAGRRARSSGRGTHRSRDPRPIGRRTTRRRTSRGGARRGRGAPPRTPRRRGTGGDRLVRPLPAG